MPREDVPRCVVAADFRSLKLDAGNHFSYTFALGGTYDYFCCLYPHMKGATIATR